MLLFFYDAKLWLNNYVSYLFPKCYLYAKEFAHLGNISSKGKVWKFLSRISVNAVLTRSSIMGFTIGKNGLQLTLMIPSRMFSEKQQTFSVNEEDKVSIWIILRENNLHTHATTVLTSLSYQQRFNSIPCSLWIPYQLTQQLLLPSIFMQTNYLYLCHKFDFSVTSKLR